jgi:hypothetical protein
MVDNPSERLIFKDNFYFRVKDVDVFNLKAIYTMMHEWFVEEEYAKDEDDFPEIYQRDRETQKRGREILIFWRLQKHPFGINFYQRVVDVLIKIIGVKDVEIMQGGKKFKVQKGVFEVKVWGFLEYDCEKKWRNHWLLSNFLDIYVNRITKKDMEVHRDELMKEMRAFQKAIKEYLNLIKYDDKRFNLKDVAKFENPYS